MASDKAFVDFVLDQIENAGEITSKSMFGEYGVFSNKKIFNWNLSHTTPSDFVSGHFQNAPTHL